MSTAAQTIANRENAQLSTGPRTPEGKSRSAANSTRHGLAGSFAVLAHESADDYDQLLTQFCEKYLPTDGVEAFLIQQMTQAAWRLARIERLEARALELALENGDPNLDPDARILKSSTTYLDQFQRYRTAAERSFHKAHKAFMDSRTADKKLEAAQARAETAEMKRQTAADIKAIDDFVYARPPFLQNEPNFTRPQSPSARPHPVNPRASVAKK